MLLKNLLISSFCLLLLTSVIAPKASAQHPVIFETFTVDCDLCDQPTQFQADMGPVVSDEASKIIHLNYHIGNFCDHMEVFCNNGNKVGARLNPSTGDPYVFYGSVDRINLTTAAGSKAESEVSNGNWGGDMETQINQEHNTTPPATLSLVNATMDKSRSQDLVFAAKVAVTATSTIGDSIIIRYAIVEDKITDPVCGHNTLLSDVVRFITLGDSVVFVPGTAAGTIDTVSFQQVNVTHTNDPDVKTANMRFIAFLESSGGGDYHVVNAADLVDNLSTLPSPPATLAIIDASMDGKSFNPGDNASIEYNSSFLPNGVKAYYSLDNGTTWVYFTDATTSPINWTVPDSLTTQGKIKLVSKDDGSLTTTEKGTFTIKQSAKITLLHPDVADSILVADSTFLIQWSDLLVSNVTIDYSFYSLTPVWHHIAGPISGTSYSWTVPDTTAYAKVRITDVNTTEPFAPSQTSPQFQILKHIVQQGVVSSTPAQPNLAITSITPNPATNGQELIVRYAAQTTPSVTMELLDLLGRSVVTRTLLSSANGVADIPTQQLSAGTYIVRMNDGTSTVTKRVEIVR